MLDQTITLDLQATWQNGAAKVFAAQLAELGITLPVSTRANDVGEVLDANGAHVLQIDPLGVRADANVMLIADCVALAINTMAGTFRLADVTLPSAPISPELNAMLDDWKLRLAAMSQEERDAMYEEQRKSFVRGMTTPCEHGALDFEQCPKCRGDAS